MSRIPTLPNGSIIIGSIKPDGVLSFAARPKVHMNEQTAQSEAIRLASTNPGTEYVIARIMRSAILPTQQVQLS